jgi:hypothetical protein
MKIFRYETSGRWLKGGMHIHSIASDGGKTFAQLAECYSSAGYDFLCRTDHWIFSDAPAIAEDGSLLWLDGVELDGQDSSGKEVHIVCVGAIHGVASEDGLEIAVRIARQQGAILILAHPFWSGNSLDDFHRWGVDGIEIYNHICQWLNGKGDALVHWNAALDIHPDALGFSVDDAHLSPHAPGWDGGWIMVNAKVRSQTAIIAAIRSGNFYSSCGPDFYSIEWDGNDINLVTSPVRFVRIIGPEWNGIRAGSLGDALITHASLPAPVDWRYAYAEIEDEHGRRAWTNNLFSGS